MSEALTLKHIACIDDDEDILRVAELTLELMGGFKVTTFSSGPAALAGLAKAMPDLVLLDVMMPKMDGPATFQAMQRRDDLKNLPVVFLTAKIQPSERRQYEAMGAAGILAKPFDPQNLAGEIERIWQGRTDVSRPDQDDTQSGGRGRR
jgi:two-component system OmpR family response regulator